MRALEKFGPLLGRVAGETDGTLRPLVLLHGRGADSQDLLDLGEVLGWRGPTVSLDAPNEWAEGGFGRSWYGGVATQRADLEESVASLLLALAAVTERWPDSEAPVLGGFSQGGVMTYELGLRYPERCAGLVVMSSFLPKDHPSRQSPPAPGSVPPLLVTHGERDPLITIDRAREAHAWLTEVGIVHGYLEDRVEHTISPRHLHAVADFLAPLQ